MVWYFKNIKTSEFVHFLFYFQVNFFKSMNSSHSNTDKNEVTDKLANTSQPLSELDEKEKAKPHSLNASKETFEEKNLAFQSLPPKKFYGMFFLVFDKL